MCDFASLIEDIFAAKLQHLFQTVLISKVATNSCSDELGRNHSKQNKCSTVKTSLFLFLNSRVLMAQVYYYHHQHIVILLLCCPLIFLKRVEAWLNLRELVHKRCGAHTNKLDLIITTCIWFPDFDILESIIASSFCVLQRLLMIKIIYWNLLQSCKTKRKKYLLFILLSPQLLITNWFLSLMAYV